MSETDRGHHDIGGDPQQIARADDRADAFLHRFGRPENILVLDAAKLDLSGIDERFRGNVVPLIFFDTLWRFIYKVADHRRQVMLEGRRYMKKLSDY